MSVKTTYGAGAVWEEARKIEGPSIFLAPPPPPRAIIPDARPLGTFGNQDTRESVTVRRSISKRSHEKIGDCAQSNVARVKLLFCPD